MIETELASAVAQFGAAGLVGWMWLTERRAASVRDTQVRELHERLIEQRTQLGVLMGVVADNTRALTALEIGQRHVAIALDRLTGALGSRTPDQGPAATLPAPCAPPSFSSPP